MKTKQEIDKLVAKNQYEYMEGVLSAGVDNYGSGSSDFYHWNKNSIEIAKAIAKNIT